VIWAIYFGPGHLPSAGTLVTGLVGLGILLLAAKRPDRSLVVLIVLFPFQGLLLAELLSLGMPASIVRHLGAWKELLALGVVLAGLRSLIGSGRHLDALDRLALGFVALVALYALAQPAIVPDSPSASNIRLLAFRETAGFVIVLFGARHAAFPAGFAKRAAGALLGAGAIVSAIGVFEAIDSSAWNDFVVHTIGYTHYQTAVLNTHATNPNDIRIYGMVGGTHIVRTGSVFLNSLSLSFWLVLPFAIGFERIVRRTATPLVGLSTALIGATLLLTQTRSAILAALIVAFLALRPAAGRRRHWRTQAILVLAAVAIVAVPGAVATGFANRVSQTNTANDNSSAGHLKGLTQGFDTLGSQPLGLGIGTAAGTGQRFVVKGLVIPENNYLEVGDELGILGFVLFVALMVALLVKLRRATRSTPDPLVAAAWAAGVGLAVGSLFLQTWLYFEVAWTYWGLAGVALGAARVRARAPVEAEARSRQRLPRVLQEPASSASL
jgi:O-antigen ligase